MGGACNNHRRKVIRCYDISYACVVKVQKLEKGDHLEGIVVEMGVI